MTTPSNVPTKLAIWDLTSGFPLVDILGRPAKPRRNQCVACGGKLPPGKAGRKCKSCRVTKEKTMPSEIVVLECSYCGKTVLARDTLECPRCGRTGCCTKDGGCMPGGKGCICPKCEEGNGSETP